MQKQNLALRARITFIVAGGAIVQVIAALTLDDAQ
jgi:hypothetical protein